MKHEDSYPKIVQVIPADGWMARYSDKEGGFDCALVCWALVEEELDGNLFRYVTGMDMDRHGEIDLCPHPHDSGGTKLVGYYNIVDQRGS